MNKTDLFFQMMENPELYTAEAWQEILSDKECRELYTMMSKTQSAINATHAENDITDEMIDAEWQRLTPAHHTSKSSSHFFSTKENCRHLYWYPHDFRHSPGSYTYLAPCLW